MRTQTDVHVAEHAKKLNAERKLAEEAYGFVGAEAHINMAISQIRKHPKSWLSVAGVPLMYLGTTAYNAELAQHTITELSGLILDGTVKDAHDIWALLETISDVTMGQDRNTVEHAVNRYKALMDADLISLGRIHVISRFFNMMAHHRPGFEEVFVDLLVTHIDDDAEVVKTIAHMLKHHEAFGHQLGELAIPKCDARLEAETLSDQTRENIQACLSALKADLKTTNPAPKNEGPAGP